jgi:signal peptide peptidase SppA
MTTPLFADLVRDTWAMEPRALEAFLQMVARLPVRTTLASSTATTVPQELHANLSSDANNWVIGTYAEAVIGAVSPGVQARSMEGPFDEASRKSRLSVAEGVASIGISGVLLKRVPNLVRWFGVEATSYGEIQQDLAQAMGDDNVKSIRLRIESPGGQVSGVKETADAIYQAATKKDITAEINDVGASAAYWLASQADKITANPNATVGSLGAYTAYADLSRMAEMQGVKIHVVSSGPNKGMGVPGAPITEVQLQPIRELINGIASGFAGDIARGRGLTKEKVSSEWMDGRVWRAEEAEKLGIIDYVKAGVSSSPGGPAAALSEEEQMANETEKAAAEDKIRSEAAAAERKRLGDLKAAFPGEDKFVMEQYEAGATVEKAEAAFSKVLRGRLEAKERELADARKPQRASGPAPVVSGGDPATTDVGSDDFLAKAREYAAEHGCSLQQAMSTLARGKAGERNSALFNKHVANCFDEAPAHAAVKAAAGIR